MMRVQIFKNLYFLLIILITGCVSPGTSTVKYTPPELVSVTNEKEVDSSLEEVWNQLIGSLAENFFIINNVEKDSRIINVSLSTNTPQENYDCGSIIRTYSYKGESETYI